MWSILQSTLPWPRVQDEAKCTPSLILHSRPGQCRLQYRPHLICQHLCQGWMICPELEARAHAALHNATVLTDFIFEKRNCASKNLSGDKKWHYKLVLILCFNVFSIFRKV